MLTPSYPYLANRPHLDRFVTMTFDAAPPPPPESKGKKAEKGKGKANEVEQAEDGKNLMDALLLGSTVGDLGFKVSQGTKGMGFGFTSSAEKYQMRLKAVNAILCNDNGAMEEPERVRFKFTGSTSIAKLSNREMAELEKARRLVEKHDGAKRKGEGNGAAAVKDGGVKKAQRENGHSGRKAGPPKRMYVFQKGKPKNPRKEAAKEN